MLKQVRDGLKGIVAWFVIVLLILAFAAWGVPELRNFTQRPPLRVGDTGFSAAEIQAAINREIVTRRLNSENGYTREDAIAQGLPDQIIARMTGQAALEEEARRLGLAMPRDVVSHFLQTADQFKNPRTGKFDNETLNNILQTYQVTVRDFEDLVRSDLMRAQLIEAISTGPGAGATIAQHVILREFEIRDIDFVTVTEDLVGVAAEPTPDDLKSYYEAEINDFTAPEYRTFSALILRNENFRDDNEVTEDLIADYYERNKARLYEQPEKRSLYQITFDAEADALAAVEALESGESFASLAEARGAPLASLTFTDAGKDDLLDPNVAEAVFNTEVEAETVVGPIEGLFGFTVAQVTAVTPEATQTLDEVRETIASQLASGEERKRLFDAVEAIENQRDTGASLTDAAEAAGLTAETFGPVDRFSFAPGGVIVDGIPGEVLAQAFSLEEGEESQAISLEDDSGYFFVAVNAITPPAPTPYEDVAEEVEARWRAEERDDRLADAVSQIRSAMADGADLAAAAEPFGAEIVEATLNRDPNHPAFTPVLIDNIFNADKGAVVTGASGPGRVIAVIKDIDHKVEAGAAAQQAAIRQYLGFQYDQEILEAYATAVRDDVGVLRDQQALERVFSLDQ